MASLPTELTRPEYSAQAGCVSPEAKPRSRQSIRSEGKIRLNVGKNYDPEIEEHRRCGLFDFLPLFAKLLPPLLILIFVVFLLAKIITPAICLLLLT